MRVDASSAGARRGPEHLVPALLFVFLGARELSAQSSPLAKPEPPDGLGRHIARLNDVDGDKCADFAIDDGDRKAWVISGKTGAVLAREEALTAPLATLGGDVNEDGAWDILTWGRGSSSTVVIRSGKDLSVLRTHKAPPAVELIWSFSVCAGDWNSDGKPDVAFDGKSDQEAALFVLSAQTGEVLHKVPADQDFFRCTQLVWQDLDHDGRPDFITATEPWRSAAQTSIVRVRRAAPESPVLTIANESIYDGFAAGLAAVPDVDGDDWLDILVVHALSGTFSQDGQAQFDAPETHRGIAGKAVIFSSKTGTPVRTLATTDAQENCEGVTVANLDDLDGDSVPEFAISFDCFILGRVVVYSGKTGQVLREHQGVEGKGPTATLSDVGRFAVCVTALGDTDGDGVGDYAIGASGGVDGLGQGCVSTYSGKTGALLRAIWKRDLVKK